jgi:hypothetical protein
MNTFVRSIVLAAGCMTGVTALMAQKPTQFDQWYRAKFGHPSASEAARIRAEADNGAYRAEKDDQKPLPAPLSYTDQYMERKQGHYTPSTEAQLRQERESSAYRADSQPTQQPEAYIDTWLRVKQGVVRAK